MNSQHTKERIHIEGNKKRSILRSIVEDVFYSFNLLATGHVNLVKSQNLIGSTGRNEAFLVLKIRLTARLSK